MTRRMIDSSLWANEHFAELPAMARLLLLGIINHADDQGRIKAHPAYLRSQVFPYDDVALSDVEGWLSAIASNGTLMTYQVDGKLYAQLLNWWEYQSLQFAAPSDYPRPDGWHDRVRFNAKGGAILTSNWITPKGETSADTCDQAGNPLQNPRANPPGNPPVSSPGNINKDQIKDQVQIEDHKAAACVAAAANPDVARIWTFWDANMPGTKTPVIVDGVNGLLDDYSAAEIEEAIRIACSRNKRNLSYVQGILAKGAFTDKATPNGGDYRPPTNGRMSPVDKSMAAADELRALLISQGKEHILHG